MSITDLTNTKWIVGTSITATAGYGNFSITTQYTYTNNGSNYLGICNGLRIGYYDSSGDGSWSSRSNNVYLTDSDMPVLKLGIYETTIQIVNGTDVTNTSLISWLTSNATQVVEPEYTLRIDGVEVTDYENVIINGVSYKCKQASVPTDLTGYTVTVPSGWSAIASEGMYAINFTVGTSTKTYSNFYVGGQYVEDLLHPIALSLANSIGCYDGGTSYKNISSTSSFTLTITGGTAVSNSTLIQWLADNNATFELIQEVGGSN